MFEKTKVMERAEFEEACGCHIIIDLDQRRSLTKQAAWVAFGIITAALLLFVLAGAVVLI